MTVIGVVEDVRPFDPTSPQVRQVYLPFAQAPSHALVYYVATADTPLSRLQDVRAAVRDVDPELPILDLQTMKETLANQFSGVRLGQASIRVNAVIAVVMAISGVYSLVAFTVARRRREIAVRVALGGTRSAIVAALLRQSLRPALIGVALGVDVQRAGESRGSTGAVRRQSARPRHLHPDHYWAVLRCGGGKLHPGTQSHARRQRRGASIGIGPNLPRP